MLIPRVHGRAGQIETPVHIAGKWTFKIEISFIGAEVPPVRMQSHVVFDSEDEAIAEMTDACEKVCRALREVAESIAQAPLPAPDTRWVQ